MLDALNTLFLVNSNNDINDLWNKIITILMPTLMGIDVMIAVFMIAFVVIKGKGDKNSEERHETIRKIVWICILSMGFLLIVSIVFGIRNIIFPLQQ